MTKKPHISFFIAFLFFSFGTLLAQQEFNSKGQRSNVVIVKFFDNQTTTLDKAMHLSPNREKMTFSKKNGYIKTGITDIDNCNKKLKATSMKRVFRHGGKFEEKHRKHGLHLWYEITYDNPTTVNEALSLYQKSRQIQVAHASYKTNYYGKYEDENISSVLSKDYNQVKTTSALESITFPNDPRYNEQWHYNNTGQEDGIAGSDIKLEKAWDIETGDSRVIVSIMDFGVDANHPDLDGNMWVNSGEIAGNGIDDDNNGYVDDINGYDFIADTGNIVVTTNHGTHIAGTIAAETNNGIGVSGIAGGTGNNDGVRIMSNVIHGGNSRGKPEEAFVYAADNGAVISQNSWNSGPRFEPAMQASIDYFIAEAGGLDAAMNGGILFFSAGNNNLTGATYPGAYEKVFSVAATDNKDKKSNFSNYGAWATISAPGGESTPGKDNSTILSTVFNNRYGFSWGTSMATPHVSGVAALIISHNYGAITPEKVKKALLQGVDPIDHLNSGYEGKLGAGRLNALRSLRASKGLGIPENLSTNNITLNGTQLSWSTVPGATQYGIRYKSLENTLWSETPLSPTTVYTLENLEKGTIYEVQVWSKNSTETSYYSSSVIFSTTIDLINPPSTINFSNITGSRAEITWSRSLGANVYEIAYKPTSASEWLQTEIREVDSRFVQLRNLMGSTEYMVKIRGKNETLTSQYSSVVKFTTSPMNCNGTPFWVHTKAYNGGDIVVYDGSIYKAKWYSEAGIIPEGSRPWSKTGECTQGGGNVSPTVSITAPINNQVLEQEVLTAITLSANASDTDGTIDTIQFEVNDTPLAQGNNVSWTPTAFGDYTIKVTATDDKGATAIHQVSITVKQKVDNQPPTVTISQPTEGQIFEQEILTAITLSANASDPDGTIDTVQFEVNGTSLTQGNNISWTPSAFGDYIIKVTVTDNKGATATDQINITVKQKVDNQPPTVNISQPTEGQIFEQEILTAITLSANASDPDGTIASIQFEVNGTALTQGNNISWTPTAFGAYTIKVTATDDKGAIASHQVSITVKQKVDNQPPTVNISQPTEGQIFEQEVLTAITLSANASDTDGTVDIVQFEVNGTSLTQGNNISWTPTAFGDYTIKVTATDDKGATAIHQVSITVKETNTGGDCNGIPSWDSSRIYPSEGGVQVSYNGNIYQNKWWTQNNIPGAGGPWGPWELIGPCSSSPARQITDTSVSFSISPNPASNLLHIQAKKAIQGPIRITLYDVTGEHQMILDNKNLKSEVQQLSYDISHSPKGFYILKMKHNNQYYTQKIVIE